MWHANGSYASIVDHSANHPRTLYKPTQDFKKLARFPNQTVRRRIGPGNQVTPSLLRR